MAYSRRGLLAGPEECGAGESWYVDSSVPGAVGECVQEEQLGPVYDPMQHYVRPDCVGSYYSLRNGLIHRICFDSDGYQYVDPTYTPHPNVPAGVTVTSTPGGGATYTAAPAEDLAALRERARLNELEAAGRHEYEATGGGHADRPEDYDADGNPLGPLPEVMAPGVSASGGRLYFDGEEITREQAAALYTAGAAGPEGAAGAPGQVPWLLLGLLGAGLVWAARK